MQRGPGRDTSPDIATWAQHALAQLARRPGVRRAGLALVEGGGRRLRFTASDRDATARVPWCHVDAYDDVPLNAAIRGGVPVAGDLDTLAARHPVFVESQRGTTTVALAAVPIVAAGQTLGGFVLFFDEPQTFDRQHLEGLGQVGSELGAQLREVQARRQRTAVPLAQEPVPSGTVTAHHEVPPDPAAVAGARRFLRQTLEEWGVDDDTAATAVLCLSELVTNAVIHSDTGCAVRVLLEDGVLTTTVRDGGSASEAEEEPREDPLRVHGRGLDLVDALAPRWGSDLDAVGTTVWFVLETG